jgi:hypothetical protein
MATLYNTLPRVQDASEALEGLGQKPLTELGLLLTKYGLQRQFGICLAHKHFDLENNKEQVVDLKDTNGNFIVSSIFTNGEPDFVIVKNYHLDLPELPEIIPSKFLVHESGLIPYEYCCIRKEEDEPAIHINPDATFLLDWVGVLERSDMRDKLGLALLQDDRTTGVERSYPSLRLNITTVMRGNITDYTPTMWHVGEGGEIVTDDWCIACSDDE